MDKTISNKLNIIRIISMIMIVVCHYLQFFENKLAFWFNVGVQIFFLLSGILYGSKDVKDYKKFWKNKFFKLYLPYIAVIIVFFIFNIILKVNEMGFMDLIYYLTATQSFNTNIVSIGHLWFMSYIFLFYLIIPFLQKMDISKDKNFYLKLILLIGLLQFFQFANIVNVNITYLSIFVVGYYFSRRKFKHNIHSDNYKVLFGISTVLCMIGIPIELYLETKEFQGILLKFITIYNEYIHVLLSITITLFLFKILPSIKNKIIDYLCNISYHVYLVHQVFILGVFSLLGLKFGIILSITVIFLLSNLSFFLFNKISKVFNKN